MTKFSAALLLGGIAFAAIAPLAPAQAAGCLKGAAVGGVAGHFVGHHAILGAVAGCAIGHHEAAVSRRQQERSPSDQQMYGRDAYRDDR